MDVLFIERYINTNRQRVEKGMNNFSEALSIAIPECSVAGTKNKV